MNGPDTTDDEITFWRSVEDFLDRRRIHRQNISAVSVAASEATVYLTTADPVDAVLETLLDTYGAGSALLGPEVDGTEQTVSLLGSKIIGIHYYNPAWFAEDERMPGETSTEEPRPAMSADEAENVYQELRRRVVAATPMSQSHGKASIWACARAIAAEIEEETGKRYVRRDMDDVGLLYAVRDDHKQRWIDRAGDIAHHLAGADPSLLTATRATRIEAIRSFMWSEDLFCASLATAGTVATEFGRLIKAGDLHGYRRP